MAITFMQTIKDSKYSKSMRIENLTSWDDTHPISNNPNILKRQNIDGAIENTKKYSTENKQVLQCRKKTPAPIV